MNEFTLLPNGKMVYQQLFEMGIHLDLGCGQGGFVENVKSVLLKVILNIIKKY